MPILRHRSISLPFIASPTFKRLPRYAANEVHEEGLLYESRTWVTIEFKDMGYKLGSGDRGQPGSWSLLAPANAKVTSKEIVVTFALPYAATVLS
jgi:hypothetical protein